MVLSLPLFLPFPPPCRPVKEADKDIIAKLKEMGRLVDASSITHSYPFCWRSDTPLIYRAVPSWFVAVENIKERLLANNKVRGICGCWWLSLVCSHGQTAHLLPPLFEWEVENIKERLLANNKVRGAEGLGPW